MNYILQKLKKHFNNIVWNEGYQCYKKDGVKILDIKRNYFTGHEDPLVVVKAESVEENGHRYTMRLILDEENIVQMFCECPNYHGYMNGFYYPNQSGCKHLAAAVRMFAEIVKTQPIEHATKHTVVQMINQYTDVRIAESYVEQVADRIEVVPKLEQTNEGFHVVFSVSKGKKYVVKDVYEFSEWIRMGVSHKYGKDLTFVHHVNAFSEESRPLVKYILGRTMENQVLGRQLGLYYMEHQLKSRSLQLAPGSTDVLFQILKDKSIEYQDKRKYKQSGSNKTKTLFCKCGNPKLTIDTKPSYADSSKTHFDGVSLCVQIPQYFMGEKHCYILSDDVIWETDEDYKKKLEPFLEGMDALEEPSFVVGKDWMNRFYNQVLPTISDYVKLTEENPEVIEEHLAPEPKFRFYLDYIKGNVLCKIEISYGAEKFKLHEQTEDKDHLRDFARESEIQFKINQYLPYYDEEIQCYHLMSEEPRLFLMLEQGIQEFMTLGAVEVTDALQKVKLYPSPKVSVGVSLKSDLLNLDIQTNDLDPKELSGILESYRLRKKYHRLKNGDFMKMENNSLESLVELVAGLNLSVKELAKGKMRIPEYRALYIDKVLQESEGVIYDRDQKFKSLLRNFKLIEDSDFIVPPSLKSVLRGYQKTGFRWLKTLTAYGFGGILADDMGLGKTIQVIAMLVSDKIENKPCFSMIVCPASLVYNWENEFQMFGKELNVRTVTGTVSEREEIIAQALDFDVLITSYDLLKRDIDQYETMEFQYEILDEAQYIKNHTTLGAKAVKLIHARNRFALTGTPIENRLSELWSIFDYMMPGFLYRYERFKKEMEMPIVRTGDERVVERLQKMVSPFILRRLKTEVLKDLPDKIEELQYAKFDTEQRLLYDAYVTKVKESLAAKSQSEFDKSKLQVLAELTRLRQLCCDPALCYDNYRGSSAKLEACMDLLHSAVDGGHKVLLFSQFTSMLDILEQRIQKEGITNYILTGKTSKEKRQQLVQQFNQDDTQVFLISLKAGGTGLNLTGADIVIHYDPWWNAAAETQATDRAHRIGQKNVVTVFKLIAKHTIEETIVKLQQDKKDLADQILQGETNQLKQMSKEDFLELLM